MRNKQQQQQQKSHDRRASSSSSTADRSCTLALVCFGMAGVSVVIGAALVLALGGIEFAVGENPCTVRFGGGSEGSIGVLNRTFNGLVYCEYRGIRYAEAPIGSLRFKNPVLRAPSGSEDWREFGNICAQLDSLGKPDQVLGDEDCLFLNVYSPAVLGSDTAKKKYPVLVYIHGGSYAIWSPQTDMFGVDLLIENEVLIVSFNYRLFVMGFLRLPEFNVTGNFGLKDQQVALLWVQRNIEAFGGDPNNVTLMGQSVGAHSVTYHLYLKPFQGLFHRAIAMSGSLLAPSAMIYQAEQFHSQYIESLGITTYNKLMSVPFADLFQFDQKQRSFNVATVGLPIFLPVVERPDEPGSLLTKPAHELLLTEPVNKVPLVIGMTSVEFTPLFSYARSFTSHDSFPNRQNGTTLQRVKLFLRRASILAERVQPDNSGDHFFGKLADLVNMYYPVKRFLRQITEVGSYQAPVYYYRFEFDGKFGKYKNSFYTRFLESSFDGAMHGDDLGYLFSPYNVREALVNRSAFKREWSMSEKNVQHICNFVKFGNPTPNLTESTEVLWTPYNENNSAPHCLNINDRNEDRLDDDRQNFIYQVWHRVYDCLYYYDCSSMNVLMDKIQRELIVDESSLTGNYSTDLESLFDEENMT